MDLSHLKQQITRDLPQFPPDVIEDWLIPFAARDGWPPTSSKWTPLLLNRPLWFWQSLSWEQQTVPVAQSAFDDRSWAAITGLVEAHVEGRVNAYSSISNSKRRFYRSLKYVLQNGRLPKPPVLLHSGWHSIADGNHRLASMHYAREKRGLLSVGASCWVGMPIVRPPSSST